MLTPSRVEIVDTGYGPEDVAGVQALIEYRRQRYGPGDPGLQMLAAGLAHYHEVMSRPAIIIGGDMDKGLAVEAFVSTVACSIKASRTAKLLTDKAMAAALRGVADALDAGTEEEPWLPKDEEEK